jgi:hypothetical protein
LPAGGCTCRKAVGACGILALPRFKYLFPGPPSLESARLLFNAPKVGTARLVPCRRRRFRRLNRHYSRGVCFIKTAHFARPAGALNVGTAHGSDRLGQHVCLSAHGAATPAASSTDGYSGIVTDIGSVHFCCAAHFTVRARPPSTNTNAAKHRLINLVNLIFRLNRIETNLLLQRAQRLDYKTNVIVHVNAQLFDSLPNVIAVHGAREGFVL